MVFSKSSIEIYFLEIEINLGHNTDLHSQITIINELSLILENTNF